ncbi:MAG TPA: ABC transporter permease [Vicinamibacterales bacterium]|nr:ABC transporter permease [Vicinamibacterales bacterium]
MDVRKRFPLRLWRPAVDEEVDTELEFHLAMRTRELMDRGLTEAQARRAAVDKFGDYSRTRRQCRAIGQQRERQMRVLQCLSELRQDAAFSIRQMFAAPAFSVLAIATLAIGIGATTAIFSAVHAVVLRPLPVPDPDRLVVVNSGWREGVMSMAPAHYLQLAEDQAAFQAIAALERTNFTLAREEGAERVIGARVTGQFFDLFRVPPAMGRVFGPPEDEPGRDRVVVLSHRLWTRQFGADPGILGRDITLNQRPHTIIGVMPPSFDLSNTAEELWVPMAFTPERKAVRSSHFLAVFARLRDGVSVQQAAAQMRQVLERRFERWPAESRERTLHVTPLMERFVGDYRQRLFVLLGAVAFVLLIACGNVSNLLLARGATRARELAVRSALGAGQGRLVRQLLTESVVLALIAAVAGVALARWLIAALIGFSPAGIPRLEQTRIDGAVLTFALGLAFMASLVFGLLPAFRASRTDVNATLKEAGRGAGSRGARDVLRATLIAGEVALALVLLVGAGLLIRTALEMQRIDPGFEMQNLFTGRVLLPPTKYTEPAVMLHTTRELEDAVARIPSVRVAAVANAIPGARGFSNGLLPEGKPLALEHITQSDGLLVSPAYLRTMGIRIVEGRAFTDADRESAPLVVMLNRTAAQRMWPGESAIGKRLTSANPAGPTTVIGIVEDVRLGGMTEPTPPTFYIPFAQLNAEAWSWPRGLFLVARTDSDPAAITNAVRRVVASIDPAIPVFNTMTMEQRMAGTFETARFNTLLLATLGGVGLLLAAVGIYGVISYFATERTSEIGIRMALGASRVDVILLVLRQAALPVFAGVALGALGAAFAARAIATQLVNVAATDPLTFVIVAISLTIVALLAAVIPARRAAAVDPTRALHSI